MATTDLAPGLKAEIVTTVDDKLVVTHMGGDGAPLEQALGLVERCRREDHRCERSAAGDERQSDIACLQAPVDGTTAEQRLINLGGPGDDDVIECVYHFAQRSTMRGRLL